MTAPKNVFELIHASGLTLAEFAKKIGHSRSTVYAWCRGAEMPRGLAPIKKFAKIAGVPPLVVWDAFYVTLSAAA
jgi:DNA-binding transcriptional regulator YiaG